MNKTLVVYNTCGVTGRANDNYYLYAIDSLLKQNFDNYAVAVSSCMNSQATRDTIQSNFKQYISYNFIDELVPVSVSFNHTVLKCIEKYGEFESYIFVDSGINLNKKPNVVRQVYELFKSGSYGMVSARAENDTGLWEWFDSGKHIDDRESHSKLFVKEHLKIPVGKAFNLHLQLFSNKIYKEYGNKILPDIFAGQCMESTFSFLCSAIKSNWIIHQDIELEHLTGMDGASSGFWPHLWEQQGNKKWDHLFRTKESIIDIIERGKKYGMGYEEISNIVLHDESQFDENEFCVNDELKEYIKNNLFLSRELLDYGKIQHSFY